MTDIKQLERQLAYSAARSDIEKIAFRMKDGTENSAMWYRVDNEYVSYRVLPILTRAIEYLESRNLLQRHPDRVELVRMLDE